MKISIIIPVKNRTSSLLRCLKAVSNQTLAPFEVIVADDSSSEDLLPICREFSANHVRLLSPGGAAGARNAGAETASGDILFFIDSDVELSPDAVASLKQYFLLHDHAAVVGSIIPEAAGRNMASQYFVLRKHFDYLLQKPPLSVLYGSVHAIRREVFLESGGFNPDFPEVEDAELGKRLANLGFYIGLSSKVTALHHHPMNIWQLLKNDFRRSALHIKLLRFQSKVASAISQGRVASFRKGAILSVISVPLTVFFSFLAIMMPLSAFLALFFFLITVFLNLPFLRFVAGELGIFRSITFLGVIFLDMTAAGLGVAWGCFKHILLPLLKRESK